VWSYDFIQNRTQDELPFLMLTVIDERTRRSMAIVFEQRVRSDDVLHCLADLFVEHGRPEHIRCVNRPKFLASNVCGWLTRIGIKTHYIEPGSPWGNGSYESFNSKLREELLNMEIFITLREALALIEQWRRHYNAVRPHSSLGYRPPAPEATLSPAPDLAHATLRTDQMLADGSRILT
jgi:transposase InsO family protein